MSTHLISGFLPWDELPEHSNRARKINLVALALAIICFVIIPFVKVPPVPRSEVKVPERIARVLEKKVELPPPPPKPPEVKKEEKKEAKPEDKPKVEKPKPIDKEPVAKAKKEAKEVAQKQISEVADALADLRDMQVEALKPATGGLQKDNGGPAGTSRNMLTSKAGAGSGGVAYNGASSSGFGGGVAGGSGSKGNLNLGSKGTTNMQGKQIAAAGNGKNGDKTRAESGEGKRTQEDIRRVFDQNGGRLFSAYQRALKDDPSMNGVVRLKLVIDPSGKVTSCEIASSELNNPELERKIVVLVNGFNFGADDVDVWKGTYPVNFYPN